MCEIRPFNAIYYTPPAGTRDISTRLAPPYDVLSAADKAALLQRDPHNFVLVDLPHVPPKEAGPPATYDAARKQLDAWLAQGVLARHSEPSIYVYHQSFRHAGATYTRRMFFARLRLEEFGKGSVFPHEQTFGGPKEDRLALTKAVQANLSPIFGLYPDATHRIAGALEAALPDAPLIEGRLDETDNRVWAVSDASAVESVRKLMSDKPIYIADGHHRYGTSLLYREWLAGQKGALREDHPANFVLCVFCALEDAGLLILPTHRVLPGCQVPPDLLARDAKIEVLPLNAATADAATQSLVRFGPQAVGLYNAATHSYAVVRPRDPGLLDSLTPDRSAAWRRLGIAFLHAYLIDRLVVETRAAGKAPEIHYVKSAAAAVDEADSTGGSVFLMQSTTMQELSAVCQAGDLMPQKSTFFYPKLASGLLINPLQ